MAVTPAHLKTPQGQFNADMFPELQDDVTALDQLLAGFITQGIAKATAAGFTTLDVKYDVVTKAWAEYLAALHIYNRLLTNPISVTIETQGQSNFTTTQLRLWKERVDGFLAAFNEAVLVPSQVPYDFPPSGRAKHRVSWGTP